jgi:hypothetical protein
MQNYKIFVYPAKYIFKYGKKNEKEKKMVFNWTAHYKSLLSFKSYFER